jgi:hypothetical protein
MRGLQRSAAATLARIMNSSISRCASSRSGHRTPTSLPSESRIELALGQVEIERIALVALLLHRA